MSHPLWQKAGVGKGGQQDRLLPSHYPIGQQAADCGGDGPTMTAPACAKVEIGRQIV